MNNHVTSTVSVAAAPPVSLLDRWGRAVARRARFVLVLAALVLAVAGVSAATIEQKLGAPDYTVEGSQSAAVEQDLARMFPALGSEQQAVVFVAEDPETTVDDPFFRAAVERVIRPVREHSSVASVITPYDAAGQGQVAASGTVAYVAVAMDGGPPDRARASRELQETVSKYGAGTGVTAVLTGASALSNDLADVEVADQQTAEIIGLPVALVVLLFVLGAFVAAAVPLAAAGAAVVLCTGVLAALTSIFPLSQFVLVIATVLGLGVGIDYALFVVSRFREELATESVEGAVGRALATSGRTVVTSGAIVIVSVGSLAMIGAHVFREIALAAGLVVFCAVVVALTALPAGLALLGTRVAKGTLPAMLRPKKSDGSSRRWEAWGRAVLRRPLVFGIPALLLLALTAVPVFRIELGMDLGLSSLRDTPSGHGQHVLQESFSAGSVGPVQILACGRGATDEAGLNSLAALTQSVGSDPDVASVVSLTSVLDDQFGGHSPADLERLVSAPTAAPIVDALVDTDRTCFYLQAVTSVAIDSSDASATVERIRGLADENDLDILVGGVTAQYTDLATVTVDSLPLVVGVVLLMSLVYLVFAFRSIFLPVKAVVLNVLATSSALGATVAMFQWGWGQGILGFDSPGTVQAFIPVALFVLLFGLSMDYEVFLVERMREEWQKTNDNDHAVLTALSRGGPQITAGATIMVAVFGALVVGDVLEVKQFGFGLAIAVLLDATLVRMVVVPAAMAVAASANWWFPGRRRRADLAAEPSDTRELADASGSR
ncbi:MMPL family transporter [Rhodococcus sp. B10]|uniref:MMPL family transporter n=1 Tax=Rhodococcus sp. B10 TaxID=2695876 RepID=UPI00143171DF|nr:Membrane protein YdfJ [Rhodococcus sp. B10]